MGVQAQGVIFEERPELSHVRPNEVSKKLGAAVSFCVRFSAILVNVILCVMSARARPRAVRPRDGARPMVHKGLPE